MRLLVLSSAALLAVAGCAIAEKKEPVVSGLQLGAKAPAYQVLDCTGPNAGKKLCYR